MADGVALPAVASVPLDNRKWVRVLVTALASLLFAVVTFGFFRWMAGLAPPTPWVHQTALTLHLVTVIPAIPLGAYILFVKKGGPRHRLLGKIWLTLMFSTAVATLFVRNINPGQLSWIHIFSLITFISVPRAYLSARRRDFRAHRSTVLGLYVGALLIAGFVALAPGRTMSQWVFGHRTTAAASHG
ncbi:MAG: DUF2306 domain-containing protein [Sphingomicrobium sp.]